MQKTRIHGCWWRILGEFPRRNVLVTDFRGEGFFDHKVIQYLNVCYIYISFIPLNPLNCSKNLPKYLDIHVASNHKSYWKPQNEPSTNTPSRFMNATCLSWGKACISKLSVGYNESWVEWSGWRLGLVWMRLLREFDWNFVVAQILNFFFQIFYFKFFKFLFSRLCLVFVFQRAIRFMRNSFTRNTTVPTFSNGPKPKRQTPNHNLYSQLPNSVLFIQKEIRGNYPGTLSE